MSKINIKQPRNDLKADNTNVNNPIRDLSTYPALDNITLPELGTISQGRDPSLISKAANKITDFFPESWQMFVPGVSDAADIALLQQAWRQKKNYLNKGVTAAGLALPIVGTKVLSRTLKDVLPTFFRDIKTKSMIIDQKLGKKADILLGNTPNPESVIKDANKFLKEGMGKKKLDVPIELSYKKNKYSIDNNIDVNIGGKTTGEIKVIPTKEYRSFTDIIKKKPAAKIEEYSALPKEGLGLNYNFPFGQKPDLDIPAWEREPGEYFFGEFEGKGINSEITQAIKKGLNKRKFNYYSGPNNKLEDSMDMYEGMLKNNKVKEVTAPGNKLPGSRVFQYLNRGNKIKKLNP